MNFLDSFSDNTRISNFMTIRCVGVESFHADRWADRHDEANSHSSYFANAPKNVRSYEFVLHKPLHIMVVIFRTHNYTIRHDLPLPLLQSFCIDITYMSSSLLFFLVVALLVIWLNLIIVQIEILWENIFFCLCFATATPYIKY